MFRRSYRKKIIIILICSFIAIYIINLFTEQLLLRKIYYFFISGTPLYCYRSPGSTLRDILNVSPPKGKSIFFHETSCNSYKSGKIVIEKRQACAVESAAKLNKNRYVYILFTSPGILKDEGTESDNILNALLSYRNINLLHVNFDNYTKNTPIEKLFESGHVEYSSYAQSHISDLLRFLTLWKYGGIYLDLDVVVIKPFANLSENFAGAESKTDVAAGVLSFSHEGIGHEYASACLNDLKNNYKFNDWGYNGPGVITRLLQKLCVAKIAWQMLGKDCKGFTVYPPSFFYPIPWPKWRMYFEEKDNDQVLHSSEYSYTIHVWNKHSADEKLPLFSNASYVMFAREFCPRVYQASNDFF